MVHFLLRRAVDDEGDGLGEPGDRAAVEGDEGLAVELEFDGLDRHGVLLRSRAF
jgi:hypothetical protein